ncbi:MAG: hypothetical protein H6701_01365 [Myxococcales bacterium]|nr:hypothetical protein [Myxococcales bacterium]
MDPATRVQLAGLLYTVVLPVGAAVAVLALGRRLRPADAQPTLVALALVAGLFAAHAGIGGAPTLSLATADGWLIYGPLIGGLAGLALDRFAPGRGLAVAAVALAVTAFVVSRLAGALAALWTGGAAEPLATAFIADAALAGALVWFALDGAARASDRPAPVVLGPLALALALGALATALSGSARMGQTMGAVAAVTGVVGLAGWRWPALRPPTRRRRRRRRRARRRARARPPLRRAAPRRRRPPARRPARRARQRPRPRPRRRLRRRRAHPRRRRRRRRAHRRPRAGQGRRRGGRRRRGR